jgi:hypothetical protein
MISSRRCVCAVVHCLGPVPCYLLRKSQSLIGYTIVDIPYIPYPARGLITPESPFALALPV